jgi:hypothetical protein
MSVTAISPVSFLNATSLIDVGQPQAPSPPQEDDQKAKGEAASASSSGSSVAVPAFMAFLPAVQPIASLSPGNEVAPALPADLGTDSSGSAPQWSAVRLDVYA